MRIILTKDIRKLGRTGQEINVKDGFGKNYLLPQGMAVRATKESLQRLEEQKEILIAKSKELQSDAKIAAESTKGKSIVFVSQCAADGRLFGSVSAKMIANKLVGLTNFDVDYSNVLLDMPIKATGVFKVDVAYHPEVIGSINVVVARSESEAQDMLLSYTQNANKAEAQESAVQAE
jgi:large subunit ribosomal protein L9